MPDPHGPGPVPVSAVNVVRQWDGNRLEVPDPGDVVTWEVGLERLGSGGIYWSVTQGVDESPHVRPVLAVVCDGMLCTSSSSSARKTALMLREPRCTLAGSVDGMDFVYDGIVRRVHDMDYLARIADAYRVKYEWPVEITADAAFNAPYGAPAAGPPPYLVFAVEPVTVRGFGTDEGFAARSTRWDFTTERLATSHPL